MEDRSSLARYMRTLPKYRKLSKIEETNYFRRIKKGDEEARTEFIGNNLCLVVSIVAPFANGNNLLDLIQEGNIGLMKAVKRFDPERGARFSTYAGWWIQQKIMRSLTKDGHTIRLPAGKRSRVKKMTDTGIALSAKLGRTATIEEIADELGGDPEDVRFLFQIAGSPESLDAEIDPDPGRSGINSKEVNRYKFIEDPNASTPFEQIAAKEDLWCLVSKVRDALHRLSSISGITPRKIKVFSYRWGLDNGFKKLTLRETSKRFWVIRAGKRSEITRERVRQIEGTCLRKLALRGHDFGGTKGWEQTLESIKALAEMVGEDVSFSSLLAK